MNDEKLRSFIPKTTRAPEQVEDKRVSVMSWLADIGHAVARKLKGVPPSPLARIHD
ncbi:MAG: hypothetical protein M4D80_22015 [Myxococcota bacterium]|nr:hypothetical protein [Deltaproteobacteria bacterium]MDQ3337846.1 hypothetical protein [Myxococcota bacterium]